MDGENNGRLSLTAQERDRLRQVARQARGERMTEAEMDASGRYSAPLPMTVVQDMLLSVIALREAREAQGLSLTAVSERSGITRAALSKIERGYGNPTFETIARIAASLGKGVRLVFEDLGSSTNAMPDAATAEVAS